MPWKGVTVSEQKQRFIEDYLLNYYSKPELARRFNVTRTTAHKWINRYLEQDLAGLEEQSRRPHSCPWQTDPAVVAEIVALRERHPSWGPKNLLICWNTGIQSGRCPRSRRRLGSWTVRGW
jgi:transposase-like protein